jgi:excisionase family DNA binding protein
MNSTEFFSPKQLAEMFRVHYQTVLSLINSGELRAERIGGQLRISADAVREYRERNVVRPAAPTGYTDGPKLPRRRRKEEPGIGSVENLRAIALARRAKMGSNNDRAGVAGTDPAPAPGVVPDAASA